jgi:hypothetical protein
MIRPELVAIVIEAVRDTLPMVPVLFVLYTVLEFVSHQQGGRLQMRSGLPGAFGPVAGAVLGVIPQCGVSVFMTSLFLSGRVTAGTLVATYLATSDEALPVLLAHRQQLDVIASIVGIKLVVGTLSGALVDALLPPSVQPAAPDSLLASRIQSHVETELHRAPWTRAVRHSARRTIEIFAWVLVITVLLGVAIEAVGLARIAAGTERHPVLAIVGAALFGMIPNCAASIAIAEGYIRGVLSFSAAVAGLCAGAGYGPILLLRRGLLPVAARLLVVCFIFSLTAGTVVWVVGALTRHSEL